MCWVMPPASPAATSVDADGVEQRSLAVVDVTHDGDDGRAHDLDHAGGVFEEALDGFVFELLFNRDDLGVGAELARDILYQLAFERLVDGDEHALHQQHCDQILAAHVELFGEVLDRDAFGDGDGLGDRQRLARHLDAAVTRWRLKALHRAFLHLLVALTAATLARTCGTQTGWRTAFRRAARCSARTGSRARWKARARREAGAGAGSEAGPCCAAGPPGPRAAGKVRVGCIGRRAPGAPAHGRTGARCAGGGPALGPPGRVKIGRRGGGTGSRRGRGVDGPRTRLRHDDATRRRCCGSAGVSA